MRVHRCVLSVAIIPANVPGTRFSTAREFRDGDIQAGRVPRAARIAAAPELRAGVPVDARNARAASPNQGCNRERPASPAIALR